MNEMHELILTDTTTVGKHQRDFWLEAEALKLRAFVYRTYGGCADGPAITFLTTSKDIHLYMGRLSREAILALSELLDDEMNPDGEARHRQILFSFPNPKGEMKSVCVTCSREIDGELIMHLSPAHS